MGKKMGRPTVEIPQQQFEALCGLMCTEEEIAYFFNCTIDTVNNWCKRTYGMTFSDVYKKKTVGGKISLRRFQFKIAEKNAAMAIFLGKQYLGQKDEPDINLASVPDDGFTAAIKGTAESDWSGEDV
jgi:hypothetical protein